MRTPREYYPKKPIVYTYEQDECPECSGRLNIAYKSKAKVVQTMGGVMTIAHRARYCVDPSCGRHKTICKSAQWQQIAPVYCTYGYDVIAHIGWRRQTHHERFETIHRGLQPRLQISESEVRYLYHDRYLPLLACHERQYLDELKAASEKSGLILELDGLAPEGGEPQLWVVREVQLGLTLRSGWLSQQDQGTFVNFLQPIADLGLRVIAVMSDKQRGLEPAVPLVFPQAKHGFCQMHYLKNAAERVADEDQTMKITLRQTVRQEVGNLIRREKGEKPGVLTVTGLIPTPVEEPQEQSKTAPQVSQPAADPIAREHETIVKDLQRRVRYLLTLKGRPPLLLAGIEMYERLTEVKTCLDTLLNHRTDSRLVELRRGLHTALTCVQSDYIELRQAANWLEHITLLLDPETKSDRTGIHVQRELFAYLASIPQKNQLSLLLSRCYAKIRQTTLNYSPGIFYCYDIPGLQRTNNGRESEFRDLNRRLLSTTGQQRLVKRIIQREGAWELIPRPDSLRDTVSALSHVDPGDFSQERQRIRQHRARFRLHTRSPKRSRAQLEQLEQRWHALPPLDSS